MNNRQNIKIPLLPTIVVMLVMHWIIVPSGWAEESLPKQLIGFDLAHLNTQVDLRAYLTVYEDIQANLSINDIVAREEQFQLLSAVSPLADFGYTESAIWFQLRLINSSDKEKRFVLYVDNPMLGKIALYLPDQDQFDYRISGREVNFSERENELNNPLFKIKWSPGEDNIIWIRAASVHPFSMPLTAFPIKEYYQQQHTLRMAEGIIWGVMIALFIYNLFLWYIERDASYFYLLAYIIAMSGINITTTGFSSFLMPECYRCSGQLNFISGTFVIITILLQMDNFLGLKTRLPYWHKVVRWVCVYTLLFTLPPAFMWDQIIYTALILPAGFALFTIMSVSAFKLMNKENPHVKIYFLSMVAPSISGFIWILYSSGFISAPPLLNVFQTTATAIQLILLSIGLGQKINRLKGETYRSQREIYAHNQQLQVKSEFLAQMSHEIRTPINGILGITNVMGATTLSEQQQNLMDTIYRSSRRLLATVNNILDFSKLEADMMTTETNEFDFEEVVNETVMLFSTMTGDKEVTIRYIYDDTLPKWFNADVGKIKQILYILLDNALTASDSGEILVEVESDPAEVADNECLVKISVIDNGSGFGYYFVNEPLSLVLKNISVKKQDDFNTGLGLNIVAQYLDILQGYCSVTSGVNKGTLVSIRLALQVVEEQVLLPKTGDAGELADIRVLVAEDNAVNQLVIKAQLSNLGCRFDIVENGKRAYDLYRSRSDQFDIILMDCEMPVLNGYDATESIRNFEDKANKKRIPIIALTSHQLEEIQKRIDNSGMDGALIKPVQYETILKLLREHLNLS